MNSSYNKLHNILKKSSCSLQNLLVSSILGIFFWFWVLAQNTEINESEKKSRNEHRRFMVVSKVILRQISPINQQDVELETFRINEGWKTGEMKPRCKYFFNLSVFVFALPSNRSQNKIFIKTTCLYSCGCVGLKQNH